MQPRYAPHERRPEPDGENAEHNEVHDPKWSELPFVEQQVEFRVTAEWRLTVDAVMPPVDAVDRHRSGDRDHPLRKLERPGAGCIAARAHPQAGEPQEL